MVIQERDNKIIFSTSNNEFEIIKETIIYGRKKNRQIEYDKKNIENTFSTKLEWLSLYIN